jgi:S-adenosylmethionine uptake transporter
MSAGWLLLDMALVTAMQVLVKAEGETYPAVQLVFLRSLVGFVSVTPLVWRHRARLANLSNVRGHLARVAFNSAALTLNFAAFADPAPRIGDRHRIHPTAHAAGDGGYHARGERQ